MSVNQTTTGRISLDGFCEPFTIPEGNDKVAVLKMAAAIIRGKNLAVEVTYEDENGKTQQATLALRLSDVVSIAKVL